jgi:hypothetical protein
MEIYTLLVVHWPETGKYNKIQIKCTSSMLAQYVGVITVKDKIIEVFVLKMCFFLYTIIS